MPAKVYTQKEAKITPIKRKRSPSSDTVHKDTRMP